METRKDPKEAAVRMCTERIRTATSPLNTSIAWTQLETLLGRQINRVMRANDDTSYILRPTDLPPGPIDTRTLLGPDEESADSDSV